MDEETAKGNKGLRPLSQPDPKCGQSSLIKPHTEGRVSSAPCVDLCSQPSPVHLDTKNTLYAGEKLMPTLVTAESCVGEEIPDPQSNDNTELQLSCHPELQSAAQDVLPPGATSRSPPPRGSKSRSVSVSKRGYVNKTRPASFAGGVFLLPFQKFRLDSPRIS